MTVVDSVWETDGLVLADKTFYKTHIAINHWQLRHYVANPEPDILYYATKYDIYYLNTNTNTRRHVAVLPFRIRCFASGYNWICAGGGDQGDFAILRLETPIRHELGGPIKCSEPDIRHFGNDIVNSVSIHKLEGPANDPGQVADDIVAVVTSNDHFVRILSLSLGREAAMLDLPFPVNHATISPDGQLLVAVGDYQQAFFYGRNPISASQRKKLDTPIVYASSLCTWELLNIVMLHVQKPAPSTGYFTTAWSPSTRLCAVASECGYVTIIDVEWLLKLEDGEDAIVALIPGTRPEPQAGPGAIRSMMFSPSPWDLLVWAEDQGRVVVADLRASCKIQQILRLDKDAPNVNKVDIESEDQQKEKIQRDGLEEAADEIQVMQSYLDQFERAAADRRRLEQQSADVQPENNALRVESDANTTGGYGLGNSVDEPVYGLQPERQVVDAVATRSGPISRAEENVSRAMPREDGERESSSTTPRSIQYRPTELGGRRGDISPETDFPALTRSMVNPNSSNDEIAAQLRLVRNYMRQRSANGVPDWEIITHQPTRDIIYTPRRQSSVVLSNEDIEAMLNTMSTVDSASRNMNTTTATPSSSSSSSLSSSSRPTRRSSDFMNEVVNNVLSRNSSSSSTNPSSSTRLSSPPGDAILAATEAVLRRRRQLERLHAMTSAANRNSSSTSSTTNINPRDAWTPIRSSPRNRTREPEDAASRAEERLERFLSGPSSNPNTAPSGPATVIPRRDSPIQDPDTPRQPRRHEAIPSPSPSTTARAPVLPDPPTFTPITAAAIHRRAQLRNLYNVREMQAQQIHGHAHALHALGVGFATRTFGPADRAFGALTAGIAWSEDGRRLWIGCDEGIWGFEVGVKGRMVRPVWEAK